jgi:adenosylcobinamide kinase / adenosylcobinamide-phosphate guanylyltransferase
MSSRLVVVLGGTRSGKSRFGRDRATSLAAGGPVTFVGTALDGDAELADRVALHRRDRPADWATIEPRTELPAAVRAAPAGTTLLVDGLTLWVSQLLTDDTRADDVVDGPIEAFREAVRRHSGPVIVVSDEVGLGLVPMEPLGRAFRDVLGIAHQRLVADSDEAWFMVAGRAIRLDQGVGE